MANDGPRSGAGELTSLPTEVKEVLTLLGKPRQHILDAYADLSQLTRGGTD
jgi:ribonucleotide monophosphatase NagD (HAD superfamily)